MPAMCRPPAPAVMHLSSTSWAAPTRMQIDGLGGTYSSTSKVMIVEPGPDSTVLYWFGQVGVDTATVDWSGNCGNLTTAVAAFAVDEGLVPAVAPVTFVRLLNGNTGVRIVAEVPVENGRVQTRGTQRVAGVPRPGAPIATHYQYPGGSVTGRLLPTGQRHRCARPARRAVDRLDRRRRQRLRLCPGRRSRCRSGDPDGRSAERRPAPVGANRTGARRGGPTDRDGRARLRRPPAFLRSCHASLWWPRPRTSRSADLEVIAVSMGAVHRALPMTAALCLAAAARIPGTVVQANAGLAGSNLRLAHPLGQVEVVSDLHAGASGIPVVKSVGVVRTARRLMSGTAFPFDEDLATLPAPVQPHGPRVHWRQLEASVTGAEP